MLHLQNLTKHYNGRVIFKGLDFSVSDCKTLVVTGPNGSGKSTLLKILCGLLRPNSGEVQWSLSGGTYSPAQMMSRVGYVSPEIGWYDRLTAVEHISFYAAMRKVHLSAADVSCLFSKVDLDKYAHDPVKQYSSGMKQRLKIACALLHSPEVLVLDEPSSNLDSKGIDMLDEIIKTSKHVEFVVLATNDAREVATYGQKQLHLGEHYRSR